MPVAETLKTYLDSRGIDHEVVLHPHTDSSMKTAEAAHIPGKRLAKAVVLEDEQGYVMVVAPSVHHIDLGVLHKQLGRRLGLAIESELPNLFPDCEPGAVPALGEAYGIETLWDSALAEEPEIYLEGGDHQLLVRISAEHLQKLLSAVRQGRFSHHLGQQLG